MTIDWQPCQTSSSKMGIFFIGEKPNCLMNHASVVEANMRTKWASALFGQIN